MNTTLKNKLSDFWIINDINLSSVNNLVGNDSVTECIELSKLRRSISDFVKIVTKQNIPVEFMSDDASFSLENSVYISGKVYDADIDSTVGLALHEATHILLTDFRLLKNIMHNIPPSIYKIAMSKNIQSPELIQIVKDIANYIEDRRIDHYMYNNSPGYSGYYLKLYDRYFNSKLITKALLSNEFTDETLDSYLYRIFNFTNPNTNLSALKGLRDIYNLIDIKNIGRLKTTKNSFDISIKILDIILNNICDVQNKNKTHQNNAKHINKISDKTQNNDSSETDITDGDSDDDDIAGDSQPLTYDTNNNVILSNSELNRLLKHIKKQRDFISGNIKKKKLSNNTIKKVNQIGSSNSSIATVCIDSDDIYIPNQKYSVVVTKRITDDMIENQLLPFISKYDINTQEVIDGFVLGGRLGRKLQIRNDVKTTMYSRKESGKIDKRLISELGFGNTDIFQHTTIDAYTNAMLHISIDISGSMFGNKMSNTILIVTAICKAISMTNENINVQVSVRYSDQLNSAGIAIVYDSRVDKISKIKKLFPKIIAGGYTPEGICFESIQNIIESSTTKLKSYFLNLSDGQPYFNNYSGKVAIEHTKKQVDLIKRSGIKVLSYFISQNGDDENLNNFKYMYGKSAKLINYNNLIEISKTLNELFINDK